MKRSWEGDTEGNVRYEREGRENEAKGPVVLTYTLSI